MKSKWREELLSALSKPPERIESERQEALAWARRRLASASGFFACASDEEGWLRGLRNEAIGKAWDAGATRRDIADASGISFSKISMIIETHVREGLYKRDPKSVIESPIASVVLTGRCSLTLIENGIHTVGDLIARSEDWLQSLPGIGEGKARDIKREVERALMVERHGGEEGYRQWVISHAERFVLRGYGRKGSEKHFATIDEAVAHWNPGSNERLVGAEFGLHYAHVRTLGEKEC